jgi:DNA-binding response OmpR family regulator
MLDKATYTELEALRERVAVLEYELHLLRETNNREVVAIMTNGNVTVGQAKMLQALSSGHVKERGELAAICCRDENESYRAIDTMIKHTRRRVPGLVISSIYGIGYQLPPESVAVVRRWINGGKTQ